MTTPHSLSEFTLDHYGDNGRVDSTTWRWIPSDDRAQKLYADGALPDDLHDAFMSEAKRANIWLLGTEVHYTEVEGSVPATFEEKLVVLDGWIWVNRSGTSLFNLPEQGSADYWAGHKHEATAKLISQDEHAATVKEINDKIRNSEPSDEYIAHMTELAHVYDVKAKRYKKLGWDDADIEAEFGPRPQIPSKKKAKS